MKKGQVPYLWITKFGEETWYLMVQLKTSKLGNTHAQEINVSQLPV
jgi:hypothetical protein